MYLFCSLGLGVWALLCPSVWGYVGELEKQIKEKRGHDTATVYINIGVYMDIHAEWYIEITVGKGKFLGNAP